MFFAGLPANTDESSSTDSPSKFELGEVQDVWLAFKSALAIYERIYDKVTEDDFCDTISENMPFPGGLCIAFGPNPLHYLCKVFKMFTQNVMFGILVGMTATHEAFENAFEKQTE